MTGLLIVSDHSIEERHSQGKAPSAISKLNSVWHDAKAISQLIASAVIESVSCLLITSTVGCAVWHDASVVSYQVPRGHLPFLYGRAS